ncbi:hypothetical protein VNO77_34272 [Canavalia gladiata]|uniref:Secreted protein n=1 Tax=Canavalia gladiata TaxID=3824 RepID=A0AAN9KES7_CANGL
MKLLNGPLLHLTVTACMALALWLRQIPAIWFCGDCGMTTDLKEKGVSSSHCLVVKNATWSSPDCSVRVGHVCTSCKGMCAPLFRGSVSTPSATFCFSKFHFFDDASEKVQSLHFCTEAHFILAGENECGT